MIDHFHAGLDEFSSFEHYDFVSSWSRNPNVNAPVIGDKPSVNARTFSTRVSEQPVDPDRPIQIGAETVLVSALQARNNARVVISGSLDLFSDTFFTPATGNQSEICSWTFKERGILSASNISHHPAGQAEAPTLYTLRDVIEFSMSVPLDIFWTIHGFRRSLEANS